MTRHVKYWGWLSPPVPGISAPARADLSWCDWR